MCGRGLKGNLENLTSVQGHDLIEKSHVAYQSIHMIVSHLWYFIALAGLYQKLLLKKLLMTFHDMR